MGIVASFADVQRLFLTHASITDTAMARLPNLPHLRELVLPFGVHDASAERIGSLTSIQVLDLGNTRLGDKGMAALEKLKSLRHLSLSGRVEGPGLSVLTGFPMLQSLQISDLARVAGRSSLEPVWQIKGLRRLKVRCGGYMTDRDFEGIEQLQELEELWLPASVTDKTIERLALLPKLKKLTVPGRGITAAGFRVLARLPELQYLNLSAATLQAGDMEPLATTTGLRSLALGEGADDTAMQCVVAMPMLEELDLRYAQVTDKGLQQVSRCRKLRHLRLGPGTTDRGLREVAKLALHSLDVQGAEITGSALELVVPTQVRCLRLEYISDECAAALRRLEHLRYLKVRGITDRAIKQLPALSGLLVLDLSQTSVTDAAATDLARLSSLHHLVLCDTRMTPQGVAALRRSLPRTSVHVKVQPRVAAWLDEAWEKYRR